MRDVIAFLASMIVLPAVVAAQTVGATTGAINGKVVDPSDSVLPGVTVTISAPQLQGTQTAITNEEGNYRFPGIPPGTYRVSYELPGFATVVREGIRVTLGFTATLNVTMQVSGLQETVTVTGASPVVDVSSTKTTTNYDYKELASIPSARDMWAILAESPAVTMSRIDVGGSAAGTQSGYRTYDAQGGQNRVMIDGLVTTEGSSAIGVYVDYGAFEEVTAGTAGHGADMGQPGVQTQMMIKSGGNQFHGSLYGDYQNSDLQAHNVTDAQVQRGIRDKEVNRLSVYHDFNGDAGGFIKKDKLWWYGSFRDFDTEVNEPRFPVRPHQTVLRHFSGKGTWALSNNNKVIGSFMRTLKIQPTRLDAYRASSPINPTEGSTQNQRHWAWVYKAEWNKVLSDAAFAEVRGGQFGYNWPLVPNEQASGPRLEDLTNNIVSGPNRDWRQHRRRNQVLGSLTYFKDGFYGSHDLKLGGEVFNESLYEAWLPGSFGNMSISYKRNGTPSEVDLFDPGEINATLNTYSFYANDTWRLNDRITLTPGLRFDRFINSLPEQEHPAGRFSSTPITFAAVDDLVSWNLFGPRLGVTYNVSGIGRTVLKFNYGQYWWNPSNDISSNANPNRSPWFRRYQWADRNGNGYWDEGEQGTLISSQGGVASTVVAPDLEDTYTREYSAWFERELATNFGVRTGVVVRQIRNQRVTNFNANRPFSAYTVPIDIPDPGPDLRTGTADDGPPLRGFNLNPALLGLPTLTTVANQPDAHGDYYTWEISGNRRMTGRWSLRASFTHTWNYDHASSYASNNVRQHALPFTPNDLINADRDDGAYRFTNWTAKLISTIQVPYGIKLTPVMRHQSGDQIGRIIQFGFNYGSQPVLVEPLNSHRMDNVTIWDLRAEKVVRFGGQNLSGFVDLYNITNSNAEFRQIWTSGSSFGFPTTIVPPRIVRVGVKLDW
ncbi:MAG TPA: carboxypeptidase regulatory-like domain-containing protein [Vicinamibacterales bacterium]|nr:carboxypeptidase regulatory-like domain-containing protein [Vicinamibacterales bacterium]